MYIKTLEVAGFNSAFKGVRNPKNSWGLSDSYIDWDDNFHLGDRDKVLAQTLIRAGGEHRKFMRQIQVWADVNMPRYFWVEADTYKFGTKNSCSTMHKLFNKKDEIVRNMFVYNDEDLDYIVEVVDYLNKLRNKWLNTNSAEEKNKLLLRAKRILPEGFLQLRTWNTNYEEIRNMYFQRRHHKLKEEWQDIFCEWVKTLPYTEELILHERQG